MAAALITPEELRRIVEDKEMEKAREALEKQRKSDAECAAFDDSLMHREPRPDALQRVSALVRGAAGRGEREVLAMRFPSESCARWPPGSGSRSWHRTARSCAPGS